MASSDHVIVHPLAIVNMSDHFTRTASGASLLPADAPVVGLLFGSVDDGQITVTDAIDVDYSRDGDNIMLLLPSVTSKCELHTTVFPNQTIVGVYRVGAALVEGDRFTIQDLRKKIDGVKGLSLGENSVFILMESNIGDGRKDIPVKCFVGNHFSKLKVKLGDETAERIAMGAALRSKPPPPGVSSIEAHVTSIINSVSSLNSRVEVLLNYLRQVDAGTVKDVDPALLNKISGLLSMLPIDEKSTQSEAVRSEDAFMAILASTIQSMDNIGRKYDSLKKKDMESDFASHPLLGEDIGDSKAGGKYIGN